MSEQTDNSTNGAAIQSPIRTVLVANRGEIAVRVMRTAKRLGIKTVAVFSEPDRNAPHVEMADFVYPLGGTIATSNYLNAEALIHAAQLTGADAIHPGYGFLSENAEFAQQCASHNIRFIGPTPAAIKAMGSKSAAKKLMENSGVPLLPGYHGDQQDNQFLADTALKIGYPIMLKASAGGGGKGMRIVASEEEFTEALGAVKRESLNSFGDDKVLIERYVEKPRHIEIQVFGDSLGNYLHLFERDCSIQRRHQKVIEEAPAPHMTETWREQMGAAAIAAAKSIAYIGAGTVEFIVDQDQQFYFMEMNTRLQVEHPVTEMITGIDLVEWQFSVAAGNPLPCAQQDLNLTGHSIEARLYAEDTQNQFLPSTGTLELLKFPTSSDSIRIESGVSEGDDISVYYDPMMAKIISYGADRNAAIDTLVYALESTQILGVANNASYLCRVLSTPAFRQAELSTAFLDEHAAFIDLQTDDNDTSSNSAEPSSTTVALSLAAVYTCLTQLSDAPNLRSSLISPQIGALRNDGWRLNTASISTYNLSIIGTSGVETIQVHRDGSNCKVECRQKILSFSQAHVRDNAITATLNSQCINAQVLTSNNLITVKKAHQEHRFSFVQNNNHLNTASGENRSMLSPMPGKVVQVLVKVGDKVEQDQPVMIIEAMKMEHTIRASQTGTVDSVFFRQNDPVEAQAQLLVINE